MAAEEWIQICKKNINMPVKKFLFIFLLMVSANGFAQSSSYAYKVDSKDSAYVLSTGLIDSTIMVLKRRLLNSGYINCTVLYNSAKKEFTVENKGDLEEEFARKWLIKPCEVFFYETYSPVELAEILAAGDKQGKIKDDKMTFYKLLNFTGNMDSYSRVSDIGTLTGPDAGAFSEVKKKLKPFLPEDCRFAYSKEITYSGHASIASVQVYALRNNEWKLPVYKMLGSAKMGVDYRGRPTISIRFNEFGRKQFARFTMKNINKAIAIVVDGLVYSAPFVNSEIEGGNAEIAGVFTKQEAKQFADMLSAGYLPVRLTLIR